MSKRIPDSIMRLAQNRYRHGDSITQITFDMSEMFGEDVANKVQAELWRTYGILNKPVKTQVIGGLRHRYYHPTKGWKLPRRLRGAIPC